MSELLYHPGSLRQRSRTRARLQTARCDQILATAILMHWPIGASAQNGGTGSTLPPPENGGLPATAAFKADVDWQNFLKPCDLRWTTLPKTWDEGAFTGNGRLGAMVHAGDGGGHSLTISPRREPF